MIQRGRLLGRGEVLGLYEKLSLAKALLSVKNESWKLVRTFRHGCFAEIAELFVGIFVSPVQHVCLAFQEC